MPTRRSAALKTPIATLDEVLARLHALARPEALPGMARFGMDTGDRLGLSVPTLRQLARELGRSHTLSQGLWRSGIADAQILAAFVAQPDQLSAEDMEAWVVSLTSWDTCDQACTNAFARSAHAWDRAAAWVQREETFVRRAGFALLAALAVHDKQAPDERFLAAMPWIAAASHDERNFVRKAVNWALRQIGKRNALLCQAAIAQAEALQQQPDKTARWIAADALRELRQR